MTEYFVNNVIVLHYDNCVKVLFQQCFILPKHYTNPVDVAAYPHGGADSVGARSS